MKTRVRYKRIGNILQHSCLYPSGHYTIEINTETLVVMVIYHGDVVDSIKLDSLVKCKKWVKNYLKDIGITFYSEVRKR